MYLSLDTMTRTYRLNSLTQAKEELLALRKAGVARTERGCSLNQALLHLAQSIEYPLLGFPQPRPALVQATVGFLASRIFLARGSMSHDLTALIPGAPLVPAEGDLAAAWDRLLLAIDRFLQHQGPLQAHFLFGQLPRDKYERMLAIHLADHLSALAP